uniref:SH2B adapter protein 1-like n=1 Tax=Petromyzon marinus TaxID=7757 RepID=A0AAJ7SPU2_PETMA|nr:SH2B adapter protein 1-like [Petromyzon marinus]
MLLSASASCGAEMSGGGGGGAGEREAPPWPPQDGPWRELCERLAREAATDFAGQYRAFTALHPQWAGPDAAATFAQIFAECFARRFRAEVGRPSGANRGGGRGGGAGGSPAAASSATSEEAAAAAASKRGSVGSDFSGREGAAAAAAASQMAASRRRSTSQEFTTKRDSVSLDPPPLRSPGPAGGGGGSPDAYPAARSAASERRSLAEPAPPPSPEPARDSAAADAKSLSSDEASSLRRGYGPEPPSRLRASFRRVCNMFRLRKRTSRGGGHLAAANVARRDVERPCANGDSSGEASRELAAAVPGAAASASRERGRPPLYRWFSWSQQRRSDPRCVRREGTLSYVVAEDVSGSQVRWRRCRLLLCRAEGRSGGAVASAAGYQLEFYVPPKSSKAKISVPCSSILEVRKTNPLEMPEKDNTFVLKTRDSMEYILETVDFLQMHSWLADIKDCLRLGNEGTRLQALGSSPSDNSIHRISSDMSASTQGLHSGGSGSHRTARPRSLDGDGGGSRFGLVDGAPPEVPPRAPVHGQGPEPTHFLPMIASGAMDTSMATGTQDCNGPLSECPWFHGTLSRLKAVQLVLTGGEERHGLFLVRESETRRGEYVLTFNYKGRAKHLRLSVSDDGCCRVQHLCFPSVAAMLERFQTEPIPLESGGIGDSVTLSRYVARAQEAISVRSQTPMQTPMRAPRYQRWNSEGDLRRPQLHTRPSAATTTAAVAATASAAMGAFPQQRSVSQTTVFMSERRKEGGVTFLRTFDPARFRELFQRRHSSRAQREPEPHSPGRPRATDNQYYVV